MEKGTGRTGQAVRNRYQSNQQHERWHLECWNKDGLAQGEARVWDPGLAQQPQTPSTNLLAGPWHASSQCSTAAPADSETECRGEGAGKILCQQLSESGTRTPECCGCECAGGKRGEKMSLQPNDILGWKPKLYEAKEWATQLLLVLHSSAPPFAQRFYLVVFTEGRHQGETHGATKNKSKIKVSG